jgi:hypothetical protein
MVALLSALSSLNTLSLEFESYYSRPFGRYRETRRPPPSKRSVILALKSFDFKGHIEYLENLVTFMDAPQLNSLFITFFDMMGLQVNTTRLAQFINRTPTLRALDEAHVEFDYGVYGPASIGYRTSNSVLDNILINIMYREPRDQLWSIKQICNSLLPLPTAEDLYIGVGWDSWDSDAIWSTLWLDLLLPFTAVKNLYLSTELAPGIVGALQELVEGRITEALPSLENIFVEGLKPVGPLQEIIGQLVARDSSPVILSPFLSGSESMPGTDRCGCSSIVVDRCPLLFKFRPIGVSCRLVLLFSIRLYYFVDIACD